MSIQRKHDDIYYVVPTQCITIGCILRRHNVDTSYIICHYWDCATSGKLFRKNMGS